MATDFNRKANKEIETSQSASLTAPLKRGANKEIGTSQSASLTAPLKREANKEIIIIICAKVNLHTGG